MLMLMASENNSNVDVADNTQGTDSNQPSSGLSSSPGTIVNQSSDSTAAVTENYSSTSAQPSAPAPRKAKKFGSKFIIIFIVFVLSLGAAAAAGYQIGKGKKEVVQPPAVKPISLPPEAIVTAECVPGRGKQYIIPKDIPQGPIYDVNGDKVIAIEYTIG